MIYIDSWIFLEFLSKDKKWVECGKVIKNPIKKVISTVVLMEIRYHGIKKFGLRKTKELLHKIKSSKRVIIIDVTKEITELAADLRVKYYDKQRRPVSYADMINLATAMITKCKTFYSGDPDFRDIEKIKTVII